MIDWPSQFNFHSVAQDIPVRFIRTPEGARIRLSEVLGSVLLHAPEQQIHLFHSHLKKWLRLKAEQYLTPLLNQLSQQHDLPISDIRYRFQKSIWGSCSSKKQISLNAKLLFLPQEMTRYVILHELAHTKHMDHSARFWGLVAKLDSDYKANRRALREADKYIPRFLLRGTK